MEFIALKKIILKISVYYIDPIILFYIVRYVLNEVITKFQTAVGNILKHFMFYKDRVESSLANFIMSWYKYSYMRAFWLHSHGERSRELRPYCSIRI